MVMMTDSNDPKFLKRVKEDKLIRKRIGTLELKKNRTTSENQELEALYHRYLVENDDIRKFWKTC
jgi:hypothetical protein